MWCNLAQHYSTADEKPLQALEQPSCPLGDHCFIYPSAMLLLYSYSLCMLSHPFPRGMGHAAAQLRESVVSPVSKPSPRLLMMRRESFKEPLSDGRKSPQGLVRALNNDVLDQAPDAKDLDADVALN